MVCEGFIKGGLIWRVGKGEKMKMLEDRWIPTSDTSCIAQNPRRGINEDTVVVDIIDKDTKLWNIFLIKEVFGVHKKWGVLG